MGGRGHARAWPSGRGSLAAGHHGPQSSAAERRDHISIGAIGVEYAAHNAVIGMVEATEPFDPSRSGGSVALLESEMARVVQSEGVVELVGWEPTTVLIDGIVHAARVRRLDSAWALVVDLPGVVIAACGPSAMASEQWELTDVTGCLGVYAVGDSTQSQTGT
jgi:hypothetical protein